MMRGGRNHPAWWAFLVHRLSGVALAIFLPAHFLVMGLALEGEARLEEFLRWSEQPLVIAGEWVLVMLLAVHLAGGLRLLAGKLLAVFAPGPVRIQTATATVQIRGTGVYVESEPNLTYFCTCFGVTEVTANDDPDSRETVVATHHNKPLYIVGGANNRGKSIAGAPFKDHTDQELALIEALVGRTLPPEFAFPAKDYDPSRTRYGR